MSKIYTKNKLAINKLANTASSSDTQLMMDESKKSQHESPASSTSDTQDSSLVTIDDLLLSQNYNPNSDVTWQIVSLEDLKRIHKDILCNQKRRKIRCKTLSKDEKDLRQTSKETIQDPPIVKPKKRGKVKKSCTSNISNTIKTIEMKIMSDEYLASSTSSESVKSYSNEYDNHVNDTKPTTSDEPHSPLFHLEDTKYNWSDEELLNDSVVETLCSNNCMDTSKENTLLLNTASIHNDAKVRSPKIRDNANVLNSSSSKEKKKSPKLKEVTILGTPSSSSEDSDLLDSEIDEILSQVQETNFVSLKVESFCNNRITRSMSKKININRTNEHDTSKKPYFLRNRTTKNTEDGILSNESVPARNTRRQYQHAPKCIENLFEDPEITDELLVNIYEDLFKDEMEIDDSIVANQKKEPHSSVTDTFEKVVPTTKNQACSKEEIERKKLEALKRRNCTLIKQKSIC